MRVLLIGQKAFGADVLRALAKENLDLVGAISGTGAPQKHDDVEDAAEECGVPCLKVSDLRAEAVYEWVENKKPDLIVMAFVTLYMPEHLVKAAPMGAINFHPSLLPKHRGISALPWTILSGDELAGLSVYHIDEGIDTGDVIIQKSVKIEEDDDFKSLYFKKIFPLGVNSVCEAVRMLRDGNAPRIKQNDAESSYEPPLKEHHLLIDWADPLDRVLRKIHAGNPGAGAITYLNGKKVRIYGGRRVAGARDADGKAGTIAGINEEGLYVQAADGVLQIMTLCIDGNVKMSGQQFADTNAIQLGDCFCMQ